MAKWSTTPPPLGKPDTAVETVCPVPPEQRPLEEYKQLRGSWFFGWANADPWLTVRPLLLSWLAVLPLSLLLASGSIPLQHNPLRLVLSALVAALVLPVLLLVRQWLGWTYVLRRLTSETVEYEESGWYDGQVWEKPLEWRKQDLLVAQYQVRPLLLGLQRLMGLTAVLLLAGTTLCRLA